MPERLPRLVLWLAAPLVLIASFGMGPRVASAQGIAPSASAAPPSGGPKLVAPHARSSTTVEYPKGASGDAEVVLVLTIAADGSVQSAVAAEGEQPFAAAAVASALTWQFDPATRDGVPFLAKIRFKVTFIQEPAVVPPSTSSSVVAPADSTKPPGTAPSVAPKPKPDEGVEVMVIGEKLAPAVTSLSRTEVREMPGAFGDPFRAVEALPGVTPIVSGLPFFYVRGAPPGNVGYFLDGIRVPYLYHVGLGPSVIHPGLVERVDLYPGGYPASFGRYAGGIVSGETTAPRTETHGEAVIRVFDLGALAETGFAGGKGTALIGFRYSYTAAILSLIAKDTVLDYRDYQARITYDLTSKDRLTLFAFGAYDLLGQTPNGTPLNILFGSEFYRVDLRYDHTFSEKSSLRYAVTLGWDQTHVADLRNAIDRLVGTRILLRHQLNKRVLLRTGADFNSDNYKSSIALYADPDNPDTQRFNTLFPPRTDFAGGVWADVVFDLDDVELTPGVRVDFFKSAGESASAVDPRLAARFKVNDKVKIIHAYGLAHQAPSFIVPVPGLVPGSLGNGLQTSFQTSAGMEAMLPASFTGTATFFHNSFFKMTDAIGTATAGLDNPNLDQRSEGRAYGFELFLRRRLGKKLGGFLTYTLSRSTRTLNGLTFPATFDRTHVANLALTYDLGRNWRAGTRLVFYSGAPKIAQGATRGLIVPPPTLSPDRDPFFYRVDVRLEKRWNFGERTWLAFVIEALNATFHKETVQGQQIGPVSIPSFGLEGGL